MPTNWNKPIEKFPMENYPDYEPGKTPRWEKLLEIDYQDEMEKIWNKKWGQQGIGKLKEVALSKPTEIESNPLFLENPEYFLLRYTELEGGEIEWKKIREGIERYADILKEENIKVHWIEDKVPEYLEKPMGAYGPLRKLFIAPNLGLVINGGAITFRIGQAGFLRGLEYYAQKFFNSIGCPILLYVTEEVCECSTGVWAAENIRLATYSQTWTKKSTDQLEPVLKAAGVELIMAHGTTMLESLESSGQFHLDSALNVVDAGLALIYPAQVSFQLVRWMKDQNYRFIEIPKAEQGKHLPANCMVLEPGKVVMNEGAEKTISALRDEGVEVIE
ncbi:hypothetical protein AKJ37_04795, partial [candidate division MSBL1 archaeon SCGC-AAA259I09]